MSFKVTAEIRNEMIADQLITAFEGGINYWCGDWTRIYPEGVAEAETGPSANQRIEQLANQAGLPEDSMGSTGWPSYAVLPLVDGHGIQIQLDDEATANGDDKPKPLNRETIQRGLELMAAGGEKIPRRHWENFISENGDAETADVFVQLCVFGEIVYG